MKSSPYCQLCRVSLLLSVAALAGCSIPSSGTATLPRPAGGVQDIMVTMIDPAADYIWASVSTTVTTDGEQINQPVTDAEWEAVRRQAILLTEGANLIQLPGRQVVSTGRELEDAGTPGNLSARQAQREIDAHWDSFLSFARALHDAGATMLASATARDAQKLLEAGDQLDQVCEGCHLQFWYPGQYIPPVEEQLSRLRQ